MSLICYCCGANMLHVTHVVESILSVLQNMTVQAALQAADQMLEGLEGSHTVLRIIIDNMLYPITVDILKQVPLLLTLLLTCPQSRQLVLLLALNLLMTITY